MTCRNFHNFWNFQANPQFLDFSEKFITIFTWISRILIHGLNEMLLEPRVYLCLLLSLLHINSDVFFFFDLHWVMVVVGNLQGMCTEQNLL